MLFRSDVVESIGINKSKQTLAEADVVLFVLDGSEKESEEDREIEKLLEFSKCIYVINKSDKKRLVEKKKNEVEISALENTNISLLKDKIVNFVIDNEIDFNSLVLTNERQLQILKDARAVVEEIKQTQFLSIDILSMLVKKLWQILGKITGNTENENIINLIFSKFCLGK